MNGTTPDHPNKTLEMLIAKGGRSHRLARLRGQFKNPAQLV